MSEEEIPREKFEAIKNVLRQRLQEPPPPSTFWNPENEGDQVYGQIIEIEERVFTRDDGQQIQYNVIHIDTPDGTVRVSTLPKMLRDQFNYWQPKPGDWIMVEFAGYREIPGRDNPMRVFKMSVVPAKEAEDLLKSGPKTAAEEAAERGAETALPGTEEEAGEKPQPAAVSPEEASKLQPYVDEVKQWFESGVPVDYQFFRDYLTRVKGLPESELPKVMAILGVREKGGKLVRD